VRAEPARRAVLAAALSGSVLSGAVVAGSVLAGCKGIKVLGSPPKPGPGVLTLDHAIAAEELMIARYQAASAALAGDSSSAIVAAVLADHRRHLAALQSRLVLPPRLATARPRPRPTPPALPAGRRAVLADLAAAERAASARLAKQLLAVPAPLAQLMASIGASEASHAVVLSGSRLV